MLFRGGRGGQNSRVAAARRSPPHSNLTKSFVTFRVSVSAAVADSGPFHSLATGGVAYTNTGGARWVGSAATARRGGGGGRFCKNVMLHKIRSRIERYFRSDLQSCLVSLFF